MHQVPLCLDDRQWPVNDDDNDGDDDDVDDDDGGGGGDYGDDYDDGDGDDDDKCPSRFKIHSQIKCPSNFVHLRLQ